MTTPQTQTLPAGKLIRALWYAWRMPELNRHRAALDNCNDPIVNEAYTAIQEGAAGLARLAGQEGGAALLLDLVFDYAPSEGMLNMLQKLRKESGLPHEFFQRISKEPVMVLPEIDPGRGEWPKEPAHTCQGKTEGGAVITIRSHETAVSPIYVPSWRDTEKRPACRGCQHRRTKREARKVLWEVGKRPLWGKFITAEKYLPFVARTRQRRKRDGITGAYVAYPLPDGRYYIIHDQEGEGGQGISDDRTAVYTLLLPIVNDTPDDKRIATSGGWGGNWQGAKGDGRVKAAQQLGKEVEPAFQAWSTDSLKKIVQALGSETKKGVKSYTVKITAEDAFKRLAKEGIAIYARGSNEQSLTDFLTRFPGLDVAVSSDGRLTLIHENVTHKEQEEKPKIPCPLCVTKEGETAEAALDLQAERQPKPFYTGVINGI